MKGVWTLVVVGVALLVWLLGGPAVSGQSPRNDSNQTLVASTTQAAPPELDLNIPMPEAINAVIYPYQSATVGSEVRGMLDVINFKEGDRVARGAVMAEVSKARYEAIVGEFRGNYESIVRTLERARDELAIQEETYEKRASTFDDLSKARAQVKIMEARREEAEFKLKQAELNLKSCIVTAPFSGLIGVLYHQPYEAVDNLEKILELVDTSKVYARVNWPEARLSELSMGKKAVFSYAGTQYEGVIEKISSLIDPASKSKRVHVIIDNPEGKLQVGMSGTLSLKGSARISQNGNGSAGLEAAVLSR
jgi:RND family efflux transporter MFP subunit